MGAIIHVSLFVFFFLWLKTSCLAERPNASILSRSKPQRPDPGPESLLGWAFRGVLAPDLPRRPLSWRRAAPCMQIDRVVFESQPKLSEEDAMQAPPAAAALLYFPPRRSQVASCRIASRREAGRLPALAASLQCDRRPPSVASCRRRPLSLGHAAGIPHGRTFASHRPPLSVRLAPAQPPTPWRATAIAWPPCHMASWRACGGGTYT